MKQKHKQNYLNLLGDGHPMDKKKILVLTEMSFQGSGYYYLMSPILEGLSSEYDIKVIGLSYDNTEHNFGFSIVECKSVQDGVAIAQNIIKLWNNGGQLRTK
jgi:hypothetical protein